MGHMLRAIGLAGLAAGAALVAGAASATTVIVPDVGDFLFFGAGDASVTYDGVTFAQSAALSNGNFYNVSSGFSGDPAVVSSQQQTEGQSNIDIILPTASDSITIDFGTFGGSDVTFALSNGSTFTLSSAGSGYNTPDIFTFSGGPFTSVQLTSNDGVLNVSSLTFDGVPEPAVWAMMLVGVGGLGAGLRRNRREGVAIAA